MFTHTLRITLAVLFVAFAGLALPAQPADEPDASDRILAYHSAITVEKDGRLLIVEKIKVRAARTIQHGIFRSLPLTYADSQRHVVRVGYHLLGVKRDGKPEAYHTESEKGTLRIYMGKRDVVVPRGEHTYTIAYRTERQLAYLRDRDELYWNVTGNEWGFPIDRAMATVTLPTRVPATDITATAYTGRAGARGRDYRSQLKEGTAYFSTSAPLKAGEGLTIVVGMPKGLVHQPDAMPEP